MPVQTAITVGSFDGAHLGHAALLSRARQAVGQRRSGSRVVAFSFFPHPLSKLRPDAAPPRLTSWAQRGSHLLELGADEVVRLEPTAELLGLSSRAFVQSMVRRHRPDVWVEGPDFRFGEGRRGDVDTLEALSSEFGFETMVVPVHEVVLNDLTLAPASSTLARWLLANGRIADVRRVLGRDYEIVGVVAPGDQRGRQIGVHTANIEGESMSPGDGIYAGLATLPDNRTFAAAISVGSKPTFGDCPRTLEAHLIGWDGACQGRPLQYGWPIGIRFLAWLREQIRYDDLPSLIAQITLDVDRAVRIVQERGIDAVQSAPAGSPL